MVSAPERHIASLLKPPQPGQSVEAGTQSATHSQRVPTMSLAPQAERPLARAPVATGRDKEFVVLQSCAPALLSGSGVPAAACCHSAFVGSRLPELASACLAWNQVMCDEGVTPATERAKILPLQSLPLTLQG